MYSLCSDVYSVKRCAVSRGDARAMHIARLRKDTLFRARLIRSESERYTLLPTTTSYYYFKPRRVKKNLFSRQGGCRDSQSSGQIEPGDSPLLKTINSMRDGSSATFKRSFFRGKRCKVRWERQFQAMTRWEEVCSAQRRQGIVCRHASGEKREKKGKRKKEKEKG